MSLKKSLDLSQNHGGAGEVLRPLFISKMALQPFEVLKSLNPLVKLLQMIFFLLGFVMSNEKGDFNHKIKESV